jgi:hypothetical protein
MALFDKVKDIRQFNWNQKVGGPDRNNQDNLPEEVIGEKNLIDQDWEGQHKKFGGVNALRGEDNLGFDQPFILKEIGDRYESANLDDGIFRGGLALNVVRAAEDVTRLTKFALTPKGILFNLKQTILQQQNARIKNRTYNPLGVLGSVIPAVHLPRHKIRDDYNNANDGKLEKIYQRRIVSGINPGGVAEVIGDAVDAVVDAFRDPLNVVNSVQVLQSTKDKLRDLNPNIPTDYKEQTESRFSTEDDKLRNEPVPFSKDGKEEESKIYKELPNSESESDELLKEKTQMVINKEELEDSNSIFSDKIDDIDYGDNRIPNSESESDELLKEKTQMVINKEELEGGNSIFSDKIGDIDYGDNRIPSSPTSYDLLEETKQDDGLINEEPYSDNSFEASLYDELPQNKSERIEKLKSKGVDNNLRNTTIPKQSVTDEVKSQIRNSATVKSDVILDYNDIPSDKLSERLKSQTQMLTNKEELEGGNSIFNNIKNVDYSGDFYSYLDSLQNDEQKSIFQYDSGPKSGYPKSTVSNINVTKKDIKSVDTQEAELYNLGKGTIKTLNKNPYSVGVSNKLQVPYGGQFGNLSTKDLPTDFIKFRIRDAVNGKWIIFPAFITNVTDTVTPEWTTERYIGRPDNVHLYNGAARNVNFEFRVAAFTKQEIPLIQEKMNALIGLGWPTFKKILSTDDEERMVAPYIYLTIGDLFNNTPGYFNNITITADESTPWEIDDGLQIPHYFTVSLDFVHVGRYLPNTLGLHYDGIKHLKDSGVGNGNFGVFGDRYPRDDRGFTTVNRNDEARSGWAKHLAEHYQMKAGVGRGVDDFKKEKPFKTPKVDRTLLDNATNSVDGMGDRVVNAMNQPSSKPVITSGGLTTSITPLTQQQLTPVPFNTTEQDNTSVSFGDFLTSDDGSFGDDAPPATKTKASNDGIRNVNGFSQRGGKNSNGTTTQQ